MKNLFFLLLFLTAAQYNFAQTKILDANKLTVKDSMVLKDKAITDISIDSAFSNESDKILSSQKAIKDFILNKHYLTGLTGWSTTGNSGTDGTSWIGTNDNHAFSMRTNGIRRLMIDSLGEVTIGGNSPSVFIKADGRTIWNGAYFSFSGQISAGSTLSAGSTIFGSSNMSLGYPGNVSPSASAILDITSTNKGVLLPRIAGSATINKTIKSFTVTNGGTGYTSAPTVLVNGLAIGATATISGGSVTAVTYPGGPNPSAYTTAAVTFSGGGGSGAAATANVDYATGTLYYNTTSNTFDYYNGTGWKSFSTGLAIPGGGTTGQVLKKNSTTDFDYSWQDDIAGTGGVASETDPTVPSVVKVITQTDKDYWSAKQQALGYTPVPDSRTINGKPLTIDITLTQSDIGLSNVDNTSDASKPVSTATANALAAKENTIATATASDYYRGDKTMQPLNKAAVGLSNVDNTSDANKPVSTATATALAGKQANVTASGLLKGTGSAIVAATKDVDYSSTAYVNVRLSQALDSLPGLTINNTGSVGIPLVTIPNDSTTNIKKVNFNGFGGATVTTDTTRNPGTLNVDITAGGGGASSIDTLFTNSQDTSALNLKATGTAGNNKSVLQLYSLATSSSTGTGRMMATNIVGEALSRYILYNDGSMGWGPGATTRDNYLSRLSNGVMKFSSDRSSGAETIIITGKIAVGGGAVPNSDAIAQYNSTTGGILVPRMIAADRTAIAATSDGLLVYQTDGTKGFYYYNASTGWQLLGANSGTGSAADINPYYDPFVHTVKSTGGNMVGETMGMTPVSATANGTVTSGSLRFTAVMIDSTTQISSISYFIRTLGAYTAGTENRLGLYSLSGTTLTQIAVTANDPNLLQAPNTNSSYVTQSLVTPVTVTPGIYYVAMMYNNNGTQTTAPQVACGPSTASGLYSGVLGGNVRWTFTVSTTTLPATQSITSTTNQNAPTYYVLNK